MDLAGINKNPNPPKKSPIGTSDLSNMVADTVQPYKSFTEVSQVLRSKAFRNNTHPDHKRVVAEYQARAQATLKAGHGSILTGT